MDLVPLKWCIPLLVIKAASKKAVRRQTPRCADAGVSRRENAIPDHNYRPKANEFCTKRHSKQNSARLRYHPHSQTASSRLARFRTESSRLTSSQMANSRLTSSQISPRYQTPGWHAPGWHDPVWHDPVWHAPGQASSRVTGSRIAGSRQTSARRGGRIPAPKAPLARQLIAPR